MKSSTAMLLVFLIVAVVLFFAGCQLFEKKRDTDSDCTVTCKECKGLTVLCEHGTQRENRYQQGGEVEESKEVKPK